MKIGAMNNPMQNLLRQIQWIGENRFGFVDLTLEPPGALAVDVNVDAVRDLLDPRLRGGAGRFGIKIDEERLAKLEARAEKRQRK